MFSVNTQNKNIFATAEDVASTLELQVARCRLPFPCDIPSRLSATRWSIGELFGPSRDRFPAAVSASFSHTLADAARGSCASSSAVLPKNDRWSHTYCDVSLRDGFAFYTTGSPSSDCFSSLSSLHVSCIDLRLLLVVRVKVSMSTSLTVPVGMCVTVCMNFSLHLLGYVNVIVIVGFGIF